jgi:hypothetical protein
LLRASTITAGASEAPAVIMDCRDEPGHDNEGIGNHQLRELH